MEKVGISTSDPSVTKDGKMNCPVCDTVYKESEHKCPYCGFENSKLEMQKSSLKER